MKKMQFALLGGLTLAASAFAAATGVEALNAEIARLLAPLQNQVTVAELAFHEALTNEERALAVSLGGLYRKIGNENTLEIRVNELSYHYGDGTAPVTKLNGSVGLDLTKVISQQGINELVPGVEEMVNAMAKDYTASYGEAIEIDAKVLEKTQDAAGNYVSIKASVKGKVDLTKLPEGKHVEDVLFTGGEAFLSVDVKRGVELSLQLVSNPLYKGFRRDQKGLKESLDALLAGDAKEINEVVDLMKRLDSGAERLVNGKKLSGF